VGPIIKEALKLIRASIPKNIDINISINAESDLILASSTQIHQVLMNLCTNAAHAMKDKTGVLSIILEDIYLSKENQSLSVNLQKGPYLDLKITDTGTGIEPSILEQIFDPFFTTKNPGEGTGMGLSVVHGIIESHGGTITIESELGKGSTFHILLPKMNNAIKTSSKTNREIPTGKERILFVDDEESIIYLGKEMLEEFGYEVTIKRSSIEAFTTFCDCPENFDLVITDKSMPDMTGFELAEKILKIQPGMPVILCSGYNDRTDIDKARSIGLKLIPKPLIMRELANAVREVLDQKG
jgi:CheY-like chemotaxis protein